MSFSFNSMSAVDRTTFLKAEIDVSLVIITYLCSVTVAGRGPTDCPVL